MKQNYSEIVKMFEDLILQTMQTNHRLHCSYAGFKDHKGYRLYYVLFPLFQYLLSSLQIIYIHEFFVRTLGEHDFTTIAWKEIRDIVQYGKDDIYYTEYFR